MNSEEIRGTFDKIPRKWTFDVLKPACAQRAKTEVELYEFALQKFQEIYHEPCVAEQTAGGGKGTLGCV